MSTARTLAVGDAEQIKQETPREKGDTERQTETQHDTSNSRETRTGRQRDTETTSRNESYTRRQMREETENERRDTKNTKAEVSQGETDT